MALSLGHTDMVPWDAEGEIVHLDAPPANLRLVIILPSCLCSASPDGEIGFASVY